MKTFRIVAVVAAAGLVALLSLRLILPQPSPPQHHPPPTPVPSPFPSPPEIGDIIDTHRGVAVYHNGPDIVASHGRHFAPCGYYYGQKWQCVEYIKRFYFDALGHAFPDVMGHAKDFFDESIPHGEINPRRGLLQFENGKDVAPEPDDLLVFTEGTFGHVAIISQVGTRHLEIVQQNILGQPRALLPLRREGSTWHVGDLYRPAGWLRKPTTSAPLTLATPHHPETIP